MIQQQRLGQFIYNKLRPTVPSGDITKDQANVAETIWNMKSEDLIKLFIEWRSTLGISKQSE